MTERKPKVGQEVARGPLAGHYRVGKRFKPPLLSFSETQTVISDWIRDDLPDLMWPLVVALLEGDSAASLIGKAQQAVIDVVPEEILHESGAALDGRLTSVERFPVEWRDPVIGSLRTRGLGERAFPATLVGVLDLYEGAPGGWLMVDPWDQGDAKPSPEEAMVFLASAVVEAVKDSQLDALVKAPTFGWLVLRGKLTMPANEVDVLRDYPVNERSRPLAEAILRSGFLALKGSVAELDVERIDDQRRWAASFWQQNWAMTLCSTGEPMIPSEGDPVVPGLVQAREAVKVSLRKAHEIYEGYVEAAMSRELVVNLHRPARHEVACGLVARAYRAVVATLAAPHRWTGEHAADVIRVLVESTWLLRWMGAQEGDSGFERFQAYGAGKRKLTRRHMADLVAKLGDEAPEYLRTATEQLSQKTGGDWGEEFQEVSVEATFAGRTLRQIADELGDLDGYRYEYQPASAVTHGEWWTIDDYCLQRCANPLHLFHLLPSLAPTPVEPKFPEPLLARLERLVDTALSVIGSDPR
jgi:hypothetical protein